MKNKEAVLEMLNKLIELIQEDEKNPSFVDNFLNKKGIEKITNKEICELWETKEYETLMKLAKERFNILEEAKYGEETVFNIEITESSPFACKMFECLTWFDFDKVAYVVSSYNSYRKDDDSLYIHKIDDESFDDVKQCLINDTIEIMKSAKEYFDYSNIKIQRGRLLLQMVDKSLQLIYFVDYTESNDDL